MKEELNIGDRVFYTMEDYDTGEDIIYEGYVVSFDDDVSLYIGNDRDDKIKLGRFYNISDKKDGDMIVGMQRDCLYTIKDLFNIKDRLTEISSKLTGYDDKLMSFIKGSD